MKFALSLLSVSMCAAFNNANSNNNVPAMGFGGYPDADQIAAEQIAVDDSRSTEAAEEGMLALPSSESAAAATTLTVDGDAVSLDELGPVIINSDGTMRRISNWDTLTERERAVTMRRIGKRNNERREKLRAEAEAANSDRAQEEDSKEPPSQPGKI